MSTEGTERCYILENQPAPRDVIHAMKLHGFETMELIENGEPALVPLGDNDVRSSRAASKDRLKCIENGPMRRPPKIDNRQVIGRWLAIPHVVAGPPDPLL